MSKENSEKEIETTMSPFHETTDAEQKGPDAEQKPTETTPDADAEQKPTETTPDADAEQKPTETTPDAEQKVQVTQDAKQKDLETLGPKNVAQPKADNIVQVEHKSEDTNEVATTENTEVFIEYNAPNTYNIVNKSTNKSFKLTRKEGECFVLQTDDTKVAPVVATNTTVVPEQKKKGMFGSFFGGKSITKKRRVTKKRNQKRGFKSRSNK
jgi:hypothetical protein